MNKASGEAKFDKAIKTEMHDSPTNFLQPDPRPDPMNGNKLKCNETYVRLYGNPFNKNPENKYDPYIEPMSEFEKDKILREIEVKKINDQGMVEAKEDAVRNIWRSRNPEAIDQDFSLIAQTRAVQCITCSAINPKGKRLCFNCLEKI